MNEKDDQIAHFGIVPKCLILRQFRNSPWTRPDVQLFATTAVGRLRPVVHRTAPAHYRLGDRWLILLYQAAEPVGRTELWQRFATWVLNLVHFG